MRLVMVEFYASTVACIGQLKGYLMRCSRNIPDIGLFRYHFSQYRELF
jgi:hypothetical protein